MAGTKLLILCLIGVVVTVLSNPTPGDNEPPRLFNLDEAVSKFAIKFHKVAAQKASGNTISSPFAIQLLLSLYATGTGGSLRQQLVDSLFLGDFDLIPQHFGSISSQLSSTPADILSIVNRLYVPPFKSKSTDKNAFPLVEKFYQDSQAYKADVRELDFQDQAKAANIINQWVAEQTHQHIKTAVSAQDIPPDTVLALLNVIYFQGKWAVKFETSETKDEDFHVTKDQTVKKPMMHVNSHFVYSDRPDIGAKILSLNYKEHPFRMVIVLPNEVDGLSSVLDKLEEKGLKSALAIKRYPVEVDLKLPKFNIDTKLDLNDLLPQVGVSKLYSEGASGLVKGESVVVSKALQKAFVKVDEEGSTAGAFTGGMSVTRSGYFEAPPPIDFHVDRPFFFAICHYNLVMFTGSYVQ